MKTGTLRDMISGVAGTTTIDRQESFFLLAFFFCFFLRFLTRSGDANAKRETKDFFAHTL